MSQIRSYRLLIVSVWVFLLAPANEVAAQHQTPKALFGRYKSAVVAILASGNFQGTGFAISPRRIVTANHVVTTEDRASYLPNIQVKLFDGTLLNAVPAVSSPPSDSQLRDYALLNTARDLAAPYLKLGTWDEISEGDELVAIGYPLGLRLLLTLTVAGRFPLDGIDAILFQGPNNRGLSGGPVISVSTGNVVGVVTSKLVGITRELSDMRKTILQTRRQGSVIIAGVNPNEAIFQLTNVLDAYLISGMGAAVAIDYAKTASASTTQVRR
jgi:S1-C subfamily serine protease